MSALKMMKEASRLRDAWREAQRIADTVAMEDIAHRIRELEREHEKHRGEIFIKAGNQLGKSPVFIDEMKRAYDEGAFKRGYLGQFNAENGLQSGVARQVEIEQELRRQKIAYNAARRGAAVAETESRTEGRCGHLYATDQGGDTVRNVFRGTRWETGLVEVSVVRDTGLEITHGNIPHDELLALARWAIKHLEKK